ncbi:alpha/beta hydrolase [Microbacterium sp. No. 7]|uniref:alpha/beta hydrolase n=1 Tax=Microbacterium sp. No. 7 TaxID=1714373 RepID=UPI0006D1E8E5|nr:alpha/beta hydrolase [Microbacterium sp. No. 7]ALJ18868.1 esterase [Microbacterium sp. No. 7]
MAIDSATQSFLAAAAAAGRKPLHESTPAEAREASAGSEAMYGSGPEMASSEDITLTAADGGSFVVRVLRPRTRPKAVLTYYHGGGWVLADIVGFDALGRTIAAAADVAVVLVNYRKAPENPFPAAVEDAWTALRWVDQNVEAIAGERVPLLVGGDSAGGNLAIVTALRAREAGGPAIELALLVYPVTDSDTGRPSYVDPANQLMLSKPAMEWFFEHYVGDGDRAHPEISPLRVPDLSGFPASVVALAEHDPLLDEGAAFAERLREVGALRDVRVFDGQMHGFFTMVNVLPGSAAAIDYLVAHVRDHLD